MQGRSSVQPYFIVAEKDSLVDWKDVQKTADSMNAATSQVLPMGHFDVYVGDLFENVVDQELNFLCKELGVK